MADVMAEIEELKKKLSQNPDSLIFVPLADAYRRAGMLDEAIEVCKKGLEKHQTYTSARVVLGRIYSEKNMLDDAIAEFKKVEAVDVDNIMVHSMLGNIYLKKKRYAEAIEQFQRVLSLNPEDLEIQEKLKEALAAKQEPAKAEPKTIEKPKVEEKSKIEEKPKAEEKPKTEEKEDLQKSLKVAEIYTKKEEFDKAIEIYKEILSKDPENISVQQKLREVYSFQEKKLEKLKQKSSSSEKSENDKITTEDILVVMKDAMGETKEKEKKEPAKTEKQVAKVLFDSNKAKEIENILKDLTNTEGMVGGIFLQRDGKIVASILPPDIDSSEIGKDIAQIVDKTEKSVLNMKQGKLNHAIIASEAGQLLFTEISNGVLFMVGNEKINMGKMSYVLKDVVAKIKALF